MHRGLEVINDTQPTTVGLVALSGLSPQYFLGSCGSEQELARQSFLAGMDQRRITTCDPTNPVPVCLGISGKGAVTEHLLSVYSQSG